MFLSHQSTDICNLKSIINCNCARGYIFLGSRHFHFSCYCSLASERLRVGGGGGSCDRQLQELTLR
jgi:hypothetical protein